METLDTLIPVPSEKQAMDWSLVLTSQGIENGIEHAPEGPGYVLCIQAPDQQRAIQAIRLYERENRHRRWTQSIKGTGLLLDWRALPALLPLVVLFFFTDVAGLDALKAQGLMDGRRVLVGEWWRLVTAMTLHADIGHLASNLVIGVLLLGFAMGALGAGRALLGSLVAGVGGNLVALLCHGAGHRSLGASGLVLGALGLLSVHSYDLWWAGESRRTSWARAIGGGCFLVLMLGVSPRSDVAAHLGGFATGILCGTCLALWHRHHVPSNRGDALCAWASLAMVSAAWLLALR